MAARRRYRTARVPGYRGWRTIDRHTDGTVGYGYGTRKATRDQTREFNERWEAGGDEKSTLT